MGTVALGTGTVVRQHPGDLGGGAMGQKNLAQALDKVCKGHSQGRGRYGHAGLHCGKRSETDSF